MPLLGTSKPIYTFVKGNDMTYSAIPVDSLPKRLARGREFDKASADALLALVADGKSAASDGVEYKNAADARKEAGKARRLLVRVAPNADLVKSRVYQNPDAQGDGKPWFWSVYLGSEPTKKAAKKS